MADPQAELIRAAERGATIVTASTRAARRVLRTIEAAPRDQSAWATPDIVDWAHWLQRLWSQHVLRS
jgi:hypothetical protein